MKRVKKLLASAAIVAALSVAAGWSLGTPTIAGGETRTLSLYHVHTKESITVTYMVKGRYVPSAMKKINYLMRDWRRNEVVTIDPKTIDLMWELHADLGSHAPIHIVCGYRSPKTNAFLKRVGRNVAKKSQHMVGKAIDLYFPDVPPRKFATARWSGRSAVLAIIAAPADRPDLFILIQAMSAIGARQSAKPKWRRFSAKAARPLAPGLTARIQPQSPPPMQMQQSLKPPMKVLTRIWRQ